MVGQTKFEKEVRISTDSVPPAALKFIEEAPFKNKIRWYKEYGLKDSSIEAKTRHKGKRWSIEFNSNGSLEDIEVEYKLSDLKPSIRQNIEKHLDEKFKNHSVDKLQFQFNGSPSAIKNWLKDQQRISGIIIKYALIVNAKVDSEYKSFEMLYDYTG